MNERIKELAEQAGKHYRTRPGAYMFPSPVVDGAIPNEYLETFAELIIKDCCNIVNQEALLTAHVPAEVNVLIGERLKSVFIKIEEHFGVK